MSDSSYTDRQASQAVQTSLTGLESVIDKWIGHGLCYDEWRMKFEAAGLLWNKALKDTLIHREYEFFRPEIEHLLSADSGVDFSTTMMRRIKGETWIKGNLNEEDKEFVRTENEKRSRERRLFTRDASERTMNNYVKRWEAEASKTRYLRSAQCTFPKNKGSVVIPSTFRHETNTSIGLAAATPNFYPSKLSCSAPTSIPNGGTYSAGHYTSHSSWKNDNFAILTSSHETYLPALDSSRPQMRLHAQEVQEANAAVVQDMDPESNWTFSYPRAADDGVLHSTLEGHVSFFEEAIAPMEYESCPQVQARGEDEVSSSTVFKQTSSNSNVESPAPATEIRTGPENEGDINILNSLSGIYPGDRAHFSSNIGYTQQPALQDTFDTSLKPSGTTQQGTAQQSHPESHDDDTEMFDPEHTTSSEYNEGVGYQQAHRCTGRRRNVPVNRVALVSKAVKESIRLRDALKVKEAELHRMRQECESLNNTLSKTTEEKDETIHRLQEMIKSMERSVKWTSRQLMGDELMFIIQSLHESANHYVKRNEQAQTLKNTTELFFSGGFHHQENMSTCRKRSSSFTGPLPHRPATSGSNFTLTGVEPALGL